MSLTCDTWLHAGMTLLTINWQNLYKALNTNKTITTWLQATGLAYKETEVSPDGNPADVISIGINPNPTRTSVSCSGADYHKFLVV